MRTWLLFEGLDTYATVEFCGQTVGTADNQFRRWEFDVTSALQTCREAPTLSLNFGSVPKIANEINETQPQRKCHSIGRT